MTITCTITTEHKYSELKQLFATELTRTHERSKIILVEEKNTASASFHITASDTTALRAAVNSVTSVLAMYEKTIEATK